MRKILFLLLVILFCMNISFAGEFEDVLLKAESGRSNAQYNLGMMYKSGLGVPQNYKEAYIWFSLAAAQGHKEALKKRNITEKKLSPQQLAEAQDLAVYKQRFISVMKTTSKKQTPKPLANPKSVNGRFITNKIEGTLFIITGKVDNLTTSQISYVNVRSALITKGKIEAMIESAYCGNIITEEMLKNSKISEIKEQLMLKNGNENINVNIAPGGSVPFMVVFSNLPDRLQNFTVKVASFEESI